MNEDYARGYIDALIDGEGYVVAPNNRGQREVVVEMCDREPVDRLAAALDLLGVRYRRRGRRARDGRKQTYAVSIASQQGLTRLQEISDLAMPTKRDRLISLLRTYVKRPYVLA